MAPKTKADVVKIFKKQRDVSKSGLSAQFDNSVMCWQYYAADNADYNDQIQFNDSLGRRRRAMININKVQQNVDTVVGFMAQNRRQAKYIARVQKDQGQELYSRNMNAVYDYTRELTNADQLESDQDLAMMVQGYGAVDTEVSYVIGQATSMPNGEIIKKTVQYPYWDTSARNKNLTDRRWDGYYEDYEIEDALALFRGSDEEDFEQVSAVDDKGDNGYKFNPFGGIYDKVKLLNNAEFTTQEQNIVRVYKHEWMEYETFYKAQNPIYVVSTPEDAMYIKIKLDAAKAAIKQVGDPIEGVNPKDIFDFDPSQEDLVFDEPTKRMLVKSLGPLIRPIPFQRRVYYTAVISGEHVFTWFKSISQSGFSVKFKTGTWNPTQKIWMGMVNPMMEPVKYYNKALTELLFTIASNSKGGVMVERGAVKDVAKFETQWAKTDATIIVEDGALTGGRIQEKTKPAVPTGLENIITLMDANISATGVDPSLFGQTDNEDQSGIFFKRRIRQILSKLARYSDSITLYQKEDARLNEDLARVWIENNRGQFMRITGPDGADEFLQLVEDMLAPSYDISIQEAAQSMDEKQETATMLSNIGQQFVQFDLPTAKAFLAESLGFLSLDGDVRNRLVQVLQPQDTPSMAQFQQLQQQMQEMQQYIQSGQVDKTKSETEKNLAIAAKTLREGNLTEAELPRTHAETIRTLEEAKKTSVEAHFIPTQIHQQGAKIHGASRTSSGA